MLEGVRFMKRIISIIMVLITTLSLCIFCACSNKEGSTVDNSYDKVQSNGTLVMGLDDTFPPMGYTDTDTGKIIGFDVDLATEVCNRLGIKLKLQPIDWQTKEMELNNGNVDCIWNGLSKTDFLDSALNLSKPYMKNNQCILVKNDADYNSLTDLKGKIFCVQDQSSAEHALDKNLVFKGSLASVVTPDSYKSAIMELENGTVDAIGIDEVVARFYMNNKPGAYRILENESGNILSLSIEDYVIAFRKNDNELKVKIEETLKQMADDGTLEIISKKWFEKDITSVKEW